MCMGRKMGGGIRRMFECMCERGLIFDAGLVTIAIPLFVMHRDERAGNENI